MNPEGPIPPETETGSSGKLIAILNAGFATMGRETELSLRLKSTFDNRFPLPTESGWQQLKDIFGFRKQSIDLSQPIKLAPIINRQKQVSPYDCVGANFASLLSDITNTKITPELYFQILNTAVAHNLGTHEANGVQVQPYIFNVLATPEFQNTFHKNVTVTYRQDLTISQLAEIAKAAKQNKNPYNLYIFTPVQSWNNETGNHLIGLQEITSDQIIAYDPNESNLRSIPLPEFQTHWKNDNGAILIFVR